MPSLRFFDHWPGRLLLGAFCFLFLMQASFVWAPKAEQVGAGQTREKRRRNRNRQARSATRPDDSQRRERFDDREDRGYQERGGYERPQEPPHHAPHYHNHDGHSQHPHPGMAAHGGVTQGNEQTLLQKLGMISLFGLFLGEEGNLLSGATGGSAAPAPQSNPAENNQAPPETATEEAEIGDGGE